MGGWVITLDTDRISVIVARKWTECEDVIALDLRAANGGILPEFSAGAHIDLEIKPGLVRQYSLYDADPHAGLYRIAILREVASRGGSQHVHESISTGDMLTISPPRNQFPLHTSAPSLLFAGGIGITPIFAMAQEAIGAGRPFELHYCCRTGNRVAFRDLIFSGALAPHAHLHLDDGPTSQALDISAKLRAATPDTHLYVCGPSGFIDAVTSCAAALDWPNSRIHYEHFQGMAAPTAPSTSFHVRLARSGREFLIPPDRTVLDVLLDNGIDIPASCCQGVCGTCLTRVLEGEPEHRDYILTDAEHARNDQFTPCCSRAKSPVLVIDL